jgi:hypothetical protein
LAPAASKPAPRKRVSTVINKGGEQDVDDFFKNLLAEKPKK